MQLLIKNLLDYARVGTRGKEFRPIDMNAAVDIALANLKSAIQESGANIEVAELPTIRGDRTQLAQLFQNLIGNAIKFRGSDSPRIRVEAERKEDEWLFAVRDNGIGIDAAHAERIFLIFQRLHGRKQFSGTGIGLAICERIVKRHGGRIWVEPNTDHGSVFYFTMDAREPDPDSEG